MEEGRKERKGGNACVYFFFVHKQGQIFCTCSRGEKRIGEQRAGLSIKIPRISPRLALSLSLSLSHFPIFIPPFYFHARSFPALLLLHLQALAVSYGGEIRRPYAVSCFKGRRQKEVRPRMERERSKARIRRERELTLKCIQTPLFFGACGCVCMWWQ